MSQSNQSLSAFKKLKIQIGVCKRLRKEVESYEKEVIYNENRIQKMRDEKKDEYDIRKQEEVLQESYMMIPDSKNRLSIAIKELLQCVEESESFEGIDSLVLEEARNLIQSQS